MSSRITTRFVSTHGQDGWSGTLAQPNAAGTDGPWATPAHAAAQLAQLPRDTAACILLRGGVYYLEAPLRIGPDASGAAHAPVTFGACPGERPILSGGRRITGWREDTVHGVPCWVADLPEAATGAWNFTQLFVNGERAPRPRWPHTGWHHFAGTPGGKQSHPWYQGPHQAFYEPGHIERWRNLDDVELVMLNAWFDQHLRIADLDEQQRLVTFKCNTLNGIFDERGDGARYAAENVFESLTLPGQWYLDRPLGKLYYLPAPGQTPDNTTVIAPRLSAVTLLYGQPDRPVCHVRFEHIAFEHMQWTLPPENPGAVQAAFIVPASVRLRHAYDCGFFGCTFARSAGYGIDVQSGSTRNRIVACRFTDLGAGGVKINHEPGHAAAGWADQAFTSIDRADIASRHELGEPDVQPFSSRTEVADCHIHHCGRIYPGAIGVWIGDAGFNHVHHNHIHHQPYTAISCGWNWNYHPNRAVANRIEHNHVHDIGMGLLSDMGAIYLLGVQPGCIVRGNHVHHVLCYGYGGSGIYPDQGSSGILIENNLVHHTQTDAISIHYGQGLTVRNNLLALTDSGVFARGREECLLTGVFEHNVCLCRATRVLGYNWSQLQSIILRNNLYASASGAVLDFYGLTWDEWQAFGMDAGSRIADPLLTDPGAGDFTLRHDSPAMAMGFVPFDTRASGPRWGDTLPATIGDVPLVPDEPRPILEAVLVLHDPPPEEDEPLDPRKRENHPARVFRPRCTPIRLTVAITNRGGDIACGKAVLTGKIEIARLDYYIEPGETFESEAFVTLGPDDDFVRLLLQEEEDRFPLVGVVVHASRDLVISRRSGVTGVGAVADALADQPRVVLHSRLGEAGRLAMAVADDHLAILLHATDHEPTPDDAAPWAHACSEVFCRVSQTPQSVQQFFLLPATPDQPAKALRMDHHAGVVRREPAIEVSSTPVRDGYVLAALIPLSLIELDATVESFVFELHLKASHRPGRPRQSAPLFGSVFSWMGMDGWAKVRVG